MRRDDDAAAIQVVEAILVAVLVAGALVFFSLAQRPVFPSDPSTQEDAQMAADALALLQGENPGKINTPNEDRLMAIVSGMLQNPSAANVQTWRDEVSDTLPFGTQWRISLYNGFGHLDILNSNSVGGAPREAAGASAYVHLVSDVSSTGVKPYEAMSQDLGPLCDLSYLGSMVAPSGQEWGDLWRSWQTTNGFSPRAVPDFAPFGDWTASSCGALGAFDVSLRLGTSTRVMYTVDLVVWDAF